MRRDSRGDKGFHDDTSFLWALAMVASIARSYRWFDVDWAVVLA